MTTEQPIVTHACQNDFRIVRLAAKTKTEFKKAGYDTKKLTCERVGWKHYGRKSYPEYRYYYVVGYYNAFDDSADKAAAELEDRGLDVQVKYHCAD